MLLDIISTTPLNIMRSQRHKKNVIQSRTDNGEAEEQ